MIWPQTAALSLVTVSAAMTTSTDLEVTQTTDLLWRGRPDHILLLTSSASLPSHPLSFPLLGTRGRSRGGWGDGWGRWQESIRRGENSWVLKSLHIHPGIRESSSHSAHTNPALVTLLECWSFFFFFTNLSNYRSGHGAQNRDRDPGRCTVTARVAEAALCFVLPKPNLPTNSSLTSLQQPIFGGCNACRLVYCVASGIPNIPIPTECVGMLFVCIV